MLSWSGYRRHRRRRWQLWWKLQVWSWSSGRHGLPKRKRLRRWWAYNAGPGSIAQASGKLGSRNRGWSTFVDVHIHIVIGS